MIKLLDLLYEIADEAEKEPTPEEQDVIEDLLGSLQEGAFDDLLAKAKKYAKKGLLTATVVAALVASPKLSSAQKAQVEDLAPTTTTAAKVKTGTSVDGILGQYTSQFKFPRAYDTTKSGGRIDLGFEGNEALKQLTSFDTTKMNQWNHFVQWMKTHQIDGKVISGNPVLDTDSTLGWEIIDAYKAAKDGNKKFWVKDDHDLKTVQSLIKAYRTYTMADWKAGAKDPKKYMHGGIKLDRPMDPNNPEDVKRVEVEYMRWARD